MMPCREHNADGFCPYHEFYRIVDGRLYPIEGKVEVEETADGVRYIVTPDVPKRLDTEAPDTVR